jgi:flagellar protein FlaG
MSSINANSPSLLNYAQPAEKPVRALQTEVRAVDVKPVKPKAADISSVDLQQAIDVVNQAVALEQRSLSFSIDDASGRSVIKVVDFETEELIKQIPTEELLKVAQDIKRLQEEMGQSIGLLIDNKV